MKRIFKAAEPHEYTTWRQRVAGTDKEDYREMPKTLRQILLKALTEEQGGLCAYTMKRIDAEVSAHVEHFKPQSLCRATSKGSDLHYINLHACYPKDGMKKRFRYGAQNRCDWWEHNGADFISPLSAHCEKRFLYKIDGTIHSVAARRDAKTTISILDLGHKSLVEDRSRVIQEFIYGERGMSPLSPAQTERALQQVCQRDNNGNYLEFCIALHDALKEHLSDLKRQAQRRKFSRKK
jgi:uncharacterized protein (TIGR02646 family)